jgi:hypothetical protein
VLIRGAKAPRLIPKSDSKGGDNENGKSRSLRDDKQKDSNGKGEPGATEEAVA